MPKETHSKIPDNKTLIKSQVIPNKNSIMLINTTMNTIVKRRNALLRIYPKTCIAYSLTLLKVKYDSQDLDELLRREAHQYMPSAGEDEKHLR